MGTSLFWRLKLKFLDTVWVVRWNEVSETSLRIYRTPLSIFQEIMIIYRISLKWDWGTKFLGGIHVIFLATFDTQNENKKYPKNLFHMYMTYMTPFFIFQEIILLLCLRSFSFLGTYWSQWFKWHFQNLQIIITPKSYSKRW